MAKTFLLSCGLLVCTAACAIAPVREWLRFHQDGPTNLSAVAEGRYNGLVLGTAVTVDLMRGRPPVQVVVENITANAVDLRIGPDGAQTGAPIGEVLLRPLDGSLSSVVTDPVPYTNQQPMRLEPGWRGTFYIDLPLGRPIVSGQSFTLQIEARSAAGGVDRRSLPLRAKPSGTMPDTGRG